MVAGTPEKLVETAARAADGRAGGGDGVGVEVVEVNGEALIVGERIEGVTQTFELFGVLDGGERGFMMIGCGSHGAASAGGAVKRRGLVVATAMRSAAALGADHGGNLVEPAAKPVGFGDAVEQTERADERFLECIIGLGLR